MGLCRQVVHPNRQCAVCWGAHLHSMQAGRAILATMAYTGGGTGKLAKRVYWKSDAQTRAGLYAAR